jgi:hypothetical protein
MESPAPRETPIENIALLASSISGTVAYALVLREYYSWWVVAPATLIALPIAMIVTALVLNFAGTHVSRIVFLGLGALLLWTAATHDDRLGSGFMGAALLILGAMARKTG